VKTPRWAVIAAVLLLTALPLIAQDAPATDAAPSASAYALGDQVLSISLGPFIPLFFMAPGGDTSETRLTLGGSGSISWMAYVSGAVRIGAEIGGIFAFGPNKIPSRTTLLALPILARAQYVLTFYPFEVPLSLGLGMNIVKYDTDVAIDLLIKPGASVMWIYDSKWSFGLNLAWWCDMQFAADPAQSRIGNFLEVTASALYHY
jgi:hypothetical protein